MKIYFRNDLEKTCFEHYMYYGDFKALTRRTTSDKISYDKAFHIDKNPKCDEHQRGLASLVYKIYDENSAGTVTHTETSKWNLRLDLKT